MKKIKNKLLILAPVVAATPAMALSAQTSSTANVNNADAPVNSNESGAPADNQAQALETKKVEYKAAIDALAKSEQANPFLSAAQIEAYKAMADATDVTVEKLDEYLAKANDLATAMLVLSQNASNSMYEKLSKSMYYESKVSEAEDAQTYKAQLSETKTAADAAIAETTKSDSTLTSKEQVDALNAKFDESYNKGLVSILNVVLNGLNDVTAPVVNAVVTSYYNDLLNKANEQLASETAKLTDETKADIMMVNDSVNTLVVASVKVKEFANANMDIKVVVNEILANSLIAQEDKDTLKTYYDKLSSSLENKADVVAGEMYVKDADMYEADLTKLSDKYAALKEQHAKTKNYDAILSDAEALNDAQRQTYSDQAKLNAQKSEDPKTVEQFSSLVKTVNDEMVTLRENLSKYEKELKDLLTNDKLPQSNKDAIQAALNTANELLTKNELNVPVIQNVATNVAREYSKAKEVLAPDYKYAEENKNDPKPTYYEYIAFGAISAVLLVAGLLIALFAGKKRKNKEDK